MPKSINIIVLGKLKDKNLESVETDYLKRIKTSKIEIHELKATAEDKEKEGRRVMDYINNKSQNSYIILLAENGAKYTSIKFSKWIFELLPQNKDIFFVIGGAEGHSEEILALSNEKLSLSPLTFPHKVARILLVEQIYRAICIKNGHPYHN